MNKNKSTIRNQKHLTLTERTCIAQELVQGSTFSSIASTLHKDPSTISKEVKRARILESAGYNGKCHNCMNYGDCFRKNMTPEELSELNDLISPLVLKGQPLSHIFAVHKDGIPVCRRTRYNYFDQCVFKARSIDLPHCVRYKKRKHSSKPRKNDYPQPYRNKRTYVDFERFMEAHPDVDVVEMDTVKGSRKKGKCLLTLLFRNCSFMMIILLPDCTQKSVIKAINDLGETIGIRTFKKYFPVILTDNGSEFKNPWDIGKAKTDTLRARQ